MLTDGISKIRYLALFLIPPESSHTPLKESTFSSCEWSKQKSALSRLVETRDSYATISLRLESEVEG